MPALALALELDPKATLLESASALEPIATACSPKALEAKPIAVDLSAVA